MRLGVETGSCSISILKMNGMISMCTMNKIVWPGNRDDLLKQDADFLQFRGNLRIFREITCIRILWLHFSTKTVGRNM